MSKTPPRYSFAGIETTLRRRRKGREFPKASLEELRWRRDIATAEGDMTLAFRLACEIDKVRGFY